MKLITNKALHNIRCIKANDEFEYYDEASAKPITLDPSKTYIIHEGKPLYVSVGDTERLRDECCSSNQPGKYIFLQWLESLPEVK